MKKLFIGLIALLFPFMVFADSSSTIKTHIKFESYKKDDSRSVQMWSNFVFMHHSQSPLFSIGGGSLSDTFTVYPHNDAYFTIAAIQLSNSEQGTEAPKIYLSDCNNLSYIMQGENYVYAHIKLIDDSHATCEFNLNN